METVTAKSYTLYTENGHWLGQVVITSDGMFASVTDYGNLSYTWRSYGNGKDFREFLCSLNVGYFGTKMYTGMAYILYGKKCEKACDLFAEKILPPLQKLLREEIEQELNPAGGQPASINMQTDPNAKQQPEETAQEATAEATTDTGTSEAGEATDTEAGGE